jgi:hypothetical protein
MLDADRGDSFYARDTPLKVRVLSRPGLVKHSFNMHSAVSR